METTNTSLNVVDDPSLWLQVDDAVQFNPPYSKWTEWFVLFLWTLLCWEGVFGQYFRDALPMKEAWWMRLTPWNLYPSELIFYNPVFLFFAALTVVIGRSPYSYRTMRSAGLLLTLLVLGMWGAIHGYLAGAPGNYWLADFRQSFLMATFVPMFAVLSNKLRLDVISLRFCRIGVIATIYCGIAGTLVFAGVWQEFDRQVPFWHGSFVLILMYALMVTRYILTGKRSFLLILGLAFGILAPLHKPAIAAFIIINGLILIITFLIHHKTEGSSLRIFVVLIIMSIFALLLLGWVFTLGQGTAVEWIQQKFFKLHVAGGGDLSGRRFELWSWGLDQWRQHPIFGTGYGFLVRADAGGEVVYVPIHNTPIELLYQFGLVGFIPIVTVCMVWLIRMYRFLKVYDDLRLFWPLLGMYIWVVTMLVACCFGKNLGLTSVGFVFWACVAFLSNAEAQWWANRQFVR